MNKTLQVLNTSTFLTQVTILFISVAQEKSDGSPDRNKKPLPIDARVVNGALQSVWHTWVVKCISYISLQTSLWDNELKDTSIILGMYAFKSEILYIYLHVFMYMTLKKISMINPYILLFNRVIQVCK